MNNPYPFYARLRQEQPVFWSERFQAWFLLRYDDVAKAFQHPKLSNQRVELYTALPGVTPDAIPSFMRLSQRMINMLDQPEHTLLRRLVNQDFTPGITEQWWPCIERVVAQLLQQIAPSERFDLVSEYAALISDRVLAEMFQVPVEDYPHLQRWSNDYGQFFGGTFHDPVTDAQRAEQATIAFEHYFRDLYAQRVQAPGEDLLSHMLPALAAGRITVDDVIAHCVVLMFGGHVTVIHQLSNGMHALLTHPDQYRVLKDRPELLSGAVDEMMRYDVSAPWVHRLVTEDIEFGGQRLRAGQIVYLGMGAANHDPEHFDHPDVFDITRSPNPHLTFGLGHHRCLAAPLARKELEIGVVQLLARFPKLRLDPDSPPHRQYENLILRGFSSMMLLT